MTRVTTQLTQSNSSYHVSFCGHSAHGGGMPNVFCCGRLRSFVHSTPVPEKALSTSTFIGNAATHLHSCIRQSRPSLNKNRYLQLQ